MTYTKGLHEIGDGLHAYLQPDGGWGWSNAGLVAGDGVSLLVDTLFDLRLTREMLDAMAPVVATAPISSVVNTHANGDHCYGNQLVSGAEIIASRETAQEMSAVTPATMHALVNMDLGDPLTPFLRHAFGAFDFEGIELTPPTRTFSGRLGLDVGGRLVELIEVGPAHTAGDTIAHVPDARAVFTGDILFVGGTPIVWAGPVANWVAACDLILELEADVIVPGHGPVTDARGVEDVKRYLAHVWTETVKRHAAGMTAYDAARDIDLGEFAAWRDSERVAVNVESIYRELDPAHEPADVIEVFTRMAEMARGRRAAT